MTIGESLKRARTKLNLDLDEVAERTEQTAQERLLGDLGGELLGEHARHRPVDDRAGPDLVGREGAVVLLGQDLAHRGLHDVHPQLAQTDRHQRSWQGGHPVGGAVERGVGQPEQARRRTADPGAT